MEGRTFIRNLKTVALLCLLWGNSIGLSAKGRAEKKAMAEVMVADSRTKKVRKVKLITPQSLLSQMKVMNEKISKKHGPEVVPEFITKLPELEKGSIGVPAREEEPTFFGIDPTLSQDTGISSPA